MTRLSALSQFTGIDEKHFHTRESINSKTRVDPDSDEFLVITDDSHTYYNVYASNAEIEQRLDEMRDEFGDTILDDDTHDKWLNRIGEADPYTFFTD